MRKRVMKKLSLGKLTVSNLSEIQGGVARGTEVDLDSKAASCFDTCYSCNPECFTAILPICIPLTISECRTVCGGMVCL